MSRLLLKTEGIRLAFGERELLRIGRLEVLDGERIALVGQNGAGKTTLLRVLAGEIEATGRIECAGGIAYLPQTEDGDACADEAQLRRWGVQGMAGREGLSGGERVRLKIAAALSRGAALMLLDEPTANLDMEGVAWLEKELRRYDGALLIVSHDRALLDAVCTSVWELEDGGIRAFPGGYSEYMRQRTLERDTAWKEYRAHREEYRRLQDAAREKTAGRILDAPRRMGNSEARLHKRSSTAVKAKLARQAKSILSRAEHMEKKERPPLEPDIRAAIDPGAPITSRTAAAVRGLTVRFGGRTVLDHAEATVPTGRRTVVMGPNGSGKTTLLRALCGGEGVLSPGVRLGVFDQEHLQVQPNRTLLESVMERSARPEWAARSVLAWLGLTARDVHKPGRILSGGERAKALLARLLVSECNLLVMDEPTNYLDLYALEALEEMLAHYEGTLLLVTHDRRLADEVADRLLWVQDGKVTAYEGGYTARQEALRAPARQAADDATRRELLRMRMAELSARIDQAADEEKRALEAEFFALAQKVRERL